MFATMVSGVHHALARPCQSNITAPRSIMMERWTGDGACCIECATNIAVRFVLFERDLPESYHLIDGFSGRNCGARFEQPYGGTR